jgi:pimeloyl-ACP methyl ester carboxylesterase
VVELLGHGRSPAPEAPSAYAPDHYVAQFELLRRHLGAERWLVCGQSLGAALTLRYVVEHPDRVLAHVFTNSNSALAPPGWGDAVRVGMEALAERVASGGRAALESLPIHPRHARRLPAEAHAELVADCALHSPVGIARTGLHTVVASPVRERATLNRVPTLLVHGTREKRFADHARYAAEAIPSLEIAPLDAGHAVNLEAADDFNRIVPAFLSRFAAV